jgi:hypothetical protein
METFVVRLWTPARGLADEISAKAVHGTLEHVPTGRKVTFHSDKELVERMLALVTVPASQAPSGPKPS